MTSRLLRRSTRSLQKDEQKGRQTTGQIGMGGGMQQIGGGGGGMQQIGGGGGGTQQITGGGGGGGRQQGGGRNAGTTSEG